MKFRNILVLVLSVCFFCLTACQNANRADTYSPAANKTILASNKNVSATKNSGAMNSNSGSNANRSSASTTADSSKDEDSEETSNMYDKDADFAEPEEITKFRYKGQLVTTITYRDGFRNVLGTKTFRNNVIVSVAPPFKQGAVIDDNPITLTIAHPSSSASEGQITIISAVPHTDVRDGVSFMVQDWDLTLDGTEISGTLEKVTYGAVHNFLEAYKELIPGRSDMGTMIWNYPIREGTKLSGTLGADEAKLEISGNVDEETRPFTAKITAVRIAD